MYNIRVKSIYLLELILTFLAMGKRMTTGEFRGLIAVAIIMTLGVFAAAWSSGRFSESEPYDYESLGVLPDSDSVATDSVSPVTVGRQGNHRNRGGNGNRDNKATKKKTYTRRSPLDEPVSGE